MAEILGKAIEKAQELMSIVTLLVLSGIPQTLPAFSSGRIAAH
jgi:hypothetical protein